MREWFFIESNWDGRKMLVQIPYRSPEEATQAAMKETRVGEFRILSYPNRDKREVLRAWKQGLMNNGQQYSQNIS
jgi:hypothetical protein